jgi:cytoskeletal protein CcmA (bactofilin family)
MTTFNILSSDSDVDVISHNTILKGNITFGDTVKIDGTIEGDIFTTEDNSILIIGKNGLVKARISCNYMVIEGLVSGNIVSTDTIEIKSTGSFFGKATAKNIIVHPGGVLEGSCKISKNDL